MASIRIALAQLNVTVGDLDGNRRRIADAVRRAAAWRADILITPELALTGYPPEDLLLKSSFIDDTRRALERLAPEVCGLTALVGWVQRGPRGELYNAAAVLAEGRMLANYHKQCLPNYGVFDEARYFRPGHEPLLLDVAGSRLGILICEDLWRPDPIAVLGRLGSQAILNLSASPYHAGKLKDRVALFSRRVREHGQALAYCNLVGGQDELVFDGGSLVLDPRGEVITQGAQFREELVLADLPIGPASTRRAPAVRVPVVPQTLPPLPATALPRLGAVEEVYEALVLGTRDYVRKNGFTTVVLGLSGGIDSSLVAAIAVDALGPDGVVGVLMPSRFTSAATRRDAEQLARGLNIRSETLSIEAGFEAYLATLKDLFAGRGPDTADQNIQARIRGNLLMALSNKFGWLVLTTGNKSELATGYCTLYGDMAGGFAMIKDVPKGLVYELAALRNRREAVIPQSVIDRPPTAELAHNQTDQDTLPPYDVVDRILKAYVEDELSVREIVRRYDFDEALVRRVARMIDTAEYKRRQTPPGIKITPRAFGKDRRMPITNGYREA